MPGRRGYCGRQRRHGGNDRDPENFCEHFNLLEKLLARAIVIHCM
jgi:hypothetical protein